MFLHAAEGLAVALILGLLTTPENKTFFVFAGGFFALFPDIDFFIYLYLNGWKIDIFEHEHREILHRPVRVILFGGAFFWYLWGYQYGLLWSFANLVHFVHDSIWEGWGIRWIPFSRKYFIWAKYCHKFVINDIAEQREIAKKYGDPHWFKKNSTINKKTVQEFCYFVSGLGLALWWIFG